MSGDFTSAGLGAVGELAGALTAGFTEVAASGDIGFAEAAFGAETVGVTGALGLACAAAAGDVAEVSGLLVVVGDEVSGF